MDGKPWCPLVPGVGSVQPQEQGGKSDGASRKCREGNHVSWSNCGHHGIHIHTTRQHETVPARHQRMCSQRGWWTQFFLGGHRWTPKFLCVNTQFFWCTQRKLIKYSRLGKADWSVIGLIGHSRLKACQPPFDNTIFFRDRGTEETPWAICILLLWLPLFSLAIFGLTQFLSLGTQVNTNFFGWRMIHRKIFGWKHQLNIWSWHSPQGEGEIFWFTKSSGVPFWTFRLIPKYSGLFQLLLLEGSKFQLLWFFLQHWWMPEQSFTLFSVQKNTKTPCRKKCQKLMKIWCERGNQVLIIMWIFRFFPELKEKRRRLPKILGKLGERWQ